MSETIAVKKLKKSQDMLVAVRVEVRALQDNHLTEELAKFYAMKGFFDGRVVKFFLDRRSRFRIEEFRNIQKLFSVRRKESKWLKTIMQRRFLMKKTD